MLQSSTPPPTSPAPKKKVGTHNGVFHCDEVLACVLLTRYTNQYQSAEIVRTRDEALLDQCDIIVDVGGKYAPPKYFDHHQREFTMTHPDYFNVKLSSAGLVYLHFPQIIPNICAKIIANTALPFVPICNKEVEKEVRDRLYDNFILAIDANDNGVDMIAPLENGMTVKKQYTINSALMNRVGRLNPMWWEDNNDQMERFKQAMELADDELVGQVRSLLLGSIQTRSIVTQAFNARTEYHKSGEILVLEKFVPWQGALFHIEKEQNVVGIVKFVLYPERNSNKWRVQAVPAAQGSFALRKGLKEEWRGIKDMGELVKVSGIEDIVFVHMNGFIGGAGSYDSTLKMAADSL